MGSIDELESLAENFPEDRKSLDLHKPKIDELRLKCPHCSGHMQRVSEVIDAWFDSGSMPFSQYHYPLGNGELFDSQFPADFICEGIDQTRGWFYSLLAISTFLKGESSYKTCVVTDLVLDKKGQKMSKSRGNVVAPDEWVKTYGSDIVRGYLMFIGPWEEGGPWNPQGIEGVHRFLHRVWNVVTGESSSAVGGKPSAQQVRELRRRTHQTIRKVSGDIERFSFNTMIAALMELNNYLMKAKETEVHGTPAWDEALELVQRALKVDGWNGAYLDSLGWVYFQMGRYDEARGPLEQAAREYPNDVTVLEHLGDVYLELGGRALAREAWVRALDAGSENEESLRAKLAKAEADAGEEAQNEPAAAESRGEIGPPPLQP